MRHIVINKYTGEVSSVHELPADYKFDPPGADFEVIQGFEHIAFTFTFFDYFFDGATFEQVAKIRT